MDAFKQKDAVSTEREIFYGVRVLYALPWIYVCVRLFIARITDFHHRTKRSRLFTSNAKINNHYGFSAFFSSPVFLRRTFFPVTFCMAAIQLGSNGSKCCCGECDQIDTFSIIVQYNGFIFFFQKTLNINSNHQYHRNNFNYTNFIEYERKSLRRLVFFFVCVAPSFADKRQFSF